MILIGALIAVGLENTCTCVYKFIGMFVKHSSLLPVGGLESAKPYSAKPESAVKESAKPTSGIC